MTYIPLNLQIKINEDLVCEPVLLTEMKSFLKVDYTDDDDLIQSLITHARQMFEQETNISFGEKNIFVWMDKHKERINIPYGPLLAVNDIFTVDSDGTETAIDATDYTIVGDQIRMNTSLSGTIKLDLQVGYDTIGSGVTGTTIPATLKTAIMKEVATQYENRANINNALAELSNNSKIILKSYKRIYGF